MFLLLIEYCTQGLFNEYLNMFKSSNREVLRVQFHYVRSLAFLIGRDTGHLADENEYSSEEYTYIYLNPWMFCICLRIIYDYHYHSWIKVWYSGAFQRPTSWPTIAFDQIFLGPQCDHTALHLIWYPQLKSSIYIKHHWI